MTNADQTEGSPSPLQVAFAVPEDMGGRIFAQPTFRAGDLGAIWSAFLDEVLLKSCTDERATDDIFGDLLRELSNLVRFTVTPERIAEVIDDPQASEMLLRGTRADDFVSELALVEFVQRSFETLEEGSGEALAGAYKDDAEQFLVRHGARYAVAGAMQLVPSLSGVFHDLLHQVSKLAGRNAAAASALYDAKLALADTRDDMSPSRIRTLIHKQVSFLEAAAAQPGARANPLGERIKQLDSWPHVTVRDSLSKLYGFASDYPGIRHAGNPASVLRELDARDVTGITVALLSYVPYLIADSDDGPDEDV
ncbi:MULTISPECIES: hypothetical protein [unclassified Microbacterium]|uniref:hypothetical protein n=1 Tax=unclassified Microbacterium TaxID=2609290 RepID=UPI0036555559